LALNDNSGARLKTLKVNKGKTSKPNQYKFSKDFENFSDSGDIDAEIPESGD